MFYIKEPEVFDGRGRGGNLVPILTLPRGKGTFVKIFQDLPSWWTGTLGDVLVDRGGHGTLGDIVVDRGGLGDILVDRCGLGDILVDRGGLGHREISYRDSSHYLLSYAIVEPEGSCQGRFKKIAVVDLLRANLVPPVGLYQRPVTPPPIPSPGRDTTPAWKRYHLPSEFKCRDGVIVGEKAFQKTIPTVNRLYLLPQDSNQTLSELAEAHLIWRCCMSLKMVAHWRERLWFLLSRNAANQTTWMLCLGQTETSLH
uniref:Uncharacterized protein n=1 Tax=Timema genevievae TaxID=629358 RepID=A0A7R9PQC0_TIMGE|nr:unnamed protein product [Timema genevievae]